jgi:CheY-like chemotaxis protein
MRRLAVLSLVVLLFDIQSAVGAHCPRPLLAGDKEKFGIDISIQGIMNHLIGLTVDTDVQTEKVAINFSNQDLAAVNLYILFLVCEAIEKDETISAEESFRLIAEAQERIVTYQFKQAVDEKQDPSADVSPPLRIISSAPNQPGIDQASILWVDDAPSNNINEIATLKAAGHDVDIATSNAEAVALSSNVKYDLVISDIARVNEPEDGLALPERLAAIASVPDVIYYVSKVMGDRTAAGHPVTNQPSVLFGLIESALAKG